MAPPVGTVQRLVQRLKDKLDTEKFLRERYRLGAERGKFNSDLRSVECSTNTVQNSNDCSLVYEVDHEFFLAQPDELNIEHCACQWVLQHQDVWRGWIEPTSFVAYMTPNSWLEFNTCFMLAFCQIGVGVLLLILNNKMLRPFWRTLCRRRHPPGAAGNGLARVESEQPVAARREVSEFSVERWASGAFDDAPAPGDPGNDDAPRCDPGNDEGCTGPQLPDKKFTFLSCFQPESNFLSDFPAPPPMDRSVRKGGLQFGPCLVSSQRDPSLQVFAIMHEGPSPQLFRCVYLGPGYCSA